MKRRASFFGKYILCVTLFVALTSSLQSQCYSFDSISSSPENGAELCPGRSITISVTSSEISSGLVDWYLSSDSDFNPFNGEGDYIGNSIVYPDEDIISNCEPCPILSAIMIDACGESEVEAANEFLIVSSGGGIASASELYIDLAPNNNFPSGVNNDINIGTDSCTFLDTPNPFLISNIRSSMNCDFTNIIGIGANDPIPAGVLVFVFMSADTDVSYNFDSFCESGQTIYVLQNSCSRTIGAFSNSSSTGCRTYSIGIEDCNNCISTITYDTQNTSNSNTTSSSVYAADLNGNGQIDYTDECNSNEVLHTNGFPCNFFFIDQIKPSPVPSVIEDFEYVLPFNFCNQYGTGEYYIRGIFHTLGSECIPIFNNSSEEFLTEPFIFSTTCLYPTINSIPDLCIGSTILLDDYVEDFNQFQLSGWSDSEDLQSESPNTFTAEESGIFTHYFYGNIPDKCYGIASVDIEVLDEIAPDPDGLITLSNNILTCIQPDAMICIESDYNSSCFGPMGQLNFTSPNCYTIIQGGDYTVVITDPINGCTTSQTFTILEDYTLPDFIVSGNFNICGGECSEITTSSTSPNVTIEVFANDIVCASSPCTICDSGTYTLIATNNDNGCTASQSFEITEQTQPTNSEISLIFCDESTVPLQPNTSFSDPIAYEWNTGETTPMIQVMEPDLYTVTVTNNAGCIEIHTFNIDSTPNPEPTITGSTTFCEGESTTLDAGPDFFDYIWNTGATTQTILVNTVGTYTVLVTEPNGCTGQAQIEITNNTLPDTIQIVLCEGETITLEASIGSIVIWSTGETSNSIEVSTAGLYYYSATDLSGCIVEYPFEVIIYENPSLEISGSSTFCAGGSTTLEVITNSENYNLIWSNFQGNTISTEQSITTNIGDIYCVSIFDLETGCNNAACIDITESTSLDLVISGDTIVCGGASILSAGNGFGAYEWSTNDITSTINVSESGNYCLTVSDISGCTGSTCIDVTVSPEMTILTNITNPSCAGETDGSIFLNVIGGIAPYSYDWTPFTSMFPNLTNLNAGAYSFTVTDAVNCSATTSVELVAAPSIALSYPNFSCIDECTDLGIDEIDDYSVIWTNDNGLSGTIDTLCEAGTYNLTITNGSGCSVVDQIIVTTIGTPLSVNLTQADESYCGCVELFLDYDVNDPNLSFSWSGPNWENANGQILACANGTYGITITDSNGCSGSDSIEVILEDDSEDADCVWPGDTNDDNIVNSFDCLNIGLAFSATGTERPGGDVIWRAQYPLSWNQFTPTTLLDYMYVDADGGGSIGEEDFDVVKDNWLLSHNFTEEDEDQTKEIPVDNRNAMDIPFYVQSDTLQENTDENLSIILGEEDNSLVGAYGVAFSVIYDPEIVVPETADVDFGNSWLGEIGTDMYALHKDFHSEGRIDVGVTRLDGQEMDGFGIFATLNITIEDVILFKGQDENRSADSLTFFSIDNVKIITAQETEIVATPQETASLLVETTGTNNLISDQFIHLHPNPANQKVVISSTIYDLKEILLYDITGRQIVLFDISNDNIFDVSNIENGLYLARIITTDGIAVKKLNIQK